MPSFNDSMTVQEGEEFMKRRDFILSMLSTGLAGPLRSTKDSRADTTAVRGLSDMPTVGGTGDRKSTRLNSSHSPISYAVFCLKKIKLQLLLVVLIGQPGISIVEHRVY